MPEKRSRARIPGKKQDPGGAAKSGSLKPRKADRKFVPRRSPGAPSKGDSTSTTIPRRKAVLSGSNAGQDS